MDVLVIAVRQGESQAPDHRLLGGRRHLVGFSVWKLVKILARIEHAA